MTSTMTERIEQEIDELQPTAEAAADQLGARSGAWPLNWLRAHWMSGSIASLLVAALGLMLTRRRRTVRQREAEAQRALVIRMAHQRVWPVALLMWKWARQHRRRT